MNIKIVIGISKSKKLGALVRILVLQGEKTLVDRQIFGDVAKDAVVWVRIALKRLTFDSCPWEDKP